MRMLGRPVAAGRALRREAALLTRDRSVWVWWLAVLCLSALALAGGLTEVRQQQATLARMQEADQAERSAVLATQRDWGSAAYAAFHLTFDPPSDFAFAALGRRDDTAWKHRVRMLALQGQIHERDAGHPVLALIGRFDFAFLAAFVLPLVLIALLHDLRASERTAGRLALLEATAGEASSLWHLRAGLRAAGVFVGAALPLGVAAWTSATDPATLFAASAGLFAHLVFWTVVCAVLAAWRQPGEVILAALIGVWILLAVVVPAAGRIAIERAVPIPSGADIVLIQREAVNDAWDVPKATTLSAFIARHPEWAAYAAVQRPFEWKWYFAFQQVGDQEAEALSDAYTAGRVERERLADRLAWLSPPVGMERSLQALARTDARALLAYEARVRDFHADLRRFHYPKLFREEPFDAATLKGMPRFAASPSAPPSGTESTPGLLPRPTGRP